MGGASFSFKRFTVVQDRAAMKVGTDGVLLGAWCSVPQTAGRALDIGAGTGLIALMLAQRGENLTVDAVDIDSESYSQACENVSASPWADRMRVIHADIKDFAISQPDRYDVIVSNPPYFADSLLSPDPARSAARHTTELTYTGLTGAAGSLLSEKGIFSVILPYDRSEDFISLAIRGGLHLTRRTDVLPTPHSTPKRSLMEFSAQFSDSEPEYTKLVIESAGRHGYSAEYVELTRSFYLKF